MSEGKLCGSPINLSTEINKEAVITITCDKYEGHEGSCGKTFYHVSKSKTVEDFPCNTRVGNVQWRKDEIGLYTE